MKTFKVEYLDVRTGNRRATELKGASAAAVEAKIREKYPQVRVMAVTEVQAAAAVPPPVVQPQSAPSPQVPELAPEARTNWVTVLLATLGIAACAGFAVLNHARISAHEAAMAKFQEALHANDVALRNLEQRARSRDERLDSSPAPEIDPTEDAPVAEPVAEDTVAPNVEPMPIPTPEPPAAAPTDPTQIITAAVRNKQVEDRFDDGDYDYANFWWDVTYRAQGLDRPTRSIKGTLVFADLFGESKLLVQTTLDEPLQPGGFIDVTGVGVESNLLKDYHNWFMSTEFNNMTFTFVVEAILYEDGQLVRFD
ncbi:MAG: hypothetical protein MK101_12035 [Phycisphaerales bacterium]|nr:hypothetical protein [Phycisphaerales bacterium]